MKTSLAPLYRILLTVIALSAGVIVLLSFVLDVEMLRMLRTVLVEWTVIIVAFALLFGIGNLLRVHARRIQSGQGVFYSLLLIAAFLAVFIPGVLVVPADSFGSQLSGLLGPTGSIVDFASRYVQRPLQATFFSLAAFFVATAAWRVFRVRSVASFVMFLTSILVLLGSIRLNVGGWELFFNDTRDWIVNVPALAGARGILLGIVLGTIVTGLRLLLGVERPYSE